MNNTLKHGPLEWSRRDNGGCETWELISGKELKLTYFCIQNYGGKPGPGFSGWKLVSGGPFDDAGAYGSLAAALDGVTPYLINRFREEAATAKTRADELSKLLAGFLAEIA